MILKVQPVMEKRPESPCRYGLAFSATEEEREDVEGACEDVEGALRM